MFKHRHPFTWLSVALTGTGFSFSLLSGGIVGPLILVFAHVCALAEFKKYTSRFQFSMIIVSASALGVLLDIRSGLMGSATAAMVLSALALVLRQAYLPVFTYMRFRLLEPILIALSGLLLSIFWFDGMFAWQTDVLPLVPFGSACFLSLSYLQDAAKMVQNARNGYRVQAGMPAPDLVLPDQDGNSVRLADYRGKHPVLLIFVRGDWCPGCHMMLRTYERNHEKFKARGIHVLGIGPDSVDVNKDMVERIGVGYKLLSDTDQITSKRYGVVYENPAIEALVEYAEGIPLPASFLVDMEGIVRYVSRPDRIGEFLDPTLIFGVLDQFPAAKDERCKAA